jgi:hypothetical protein
MVEFVIYKWPYKLWVIEQKLFTRLVCSLIVTMMEVVEITEDRMMYRRRHACVCDATQIFSQIPAILSLSDVR